MFMLVPKIPISGNRLIQRNKIMEYPKNSAKKFVTPPKEINKQAISQKKIYGKKKNEKTQLMLINVKLISHCGS